MTPRLTVLMPVYNASLFLKEAMDSILSQTFSNFEFLIVDDGSTDDSIQIIEGYTDERIRLVRNEKNLGISQTLNRGIEIASCDLIARMDADDISYPQRLQKQYAYMIDNPSCGLLSTWARVVTADKKTVTVEKHSHHYYYYNLNFECWIYHPTVLFRREVVKKAGMYSMPYSEDYDLFWKIARDFKIDNMDEVLLDYRLSPHSLNTVLRKEEYAVANRENVLRNLRYYMGNNFQIREEYLECLRHNFTPLLALQNMDHVIECLRILDEITIAILNKPNVNLDKKQASMAAWHKKDFIVEQIASDLSNVEKFVLSIRSKKPEIMFRKLRKSIRWRFNSVKQHLMSPNKR